MAITHPIEWHVDLENGVSTNGGSSWDVLESGTDGVTNGTTTFTSASATFTEAMVGHIICITNVYKQIAGYTDANTITLDSTYTTGSSRTYAVGGPVNDCWSAGPYASVSETEGDTIKIAKTDSPHSIGDATWTNASATVTLEAARTETLCLCESGWNNSANITCSTTTTNKEGTNAATFAVGTDFTTGQMAWIVTPSAEMDLSDYQGISFWIKSSIDLASTKVFKISTFISNDGTGAATDTFTITVNLESGRWHCCTIWKDGGGDLGTGIDSIGISVDVDPGTPTITLDNIIAVKTDDISLTSVISPTASAEDQTDETWYPIASINGTTVKLDNYPSTDAGGGRGYSSADTPKTVETYVMTPYLVGPAATSSAYVVNFSSLSDAVASSPLVMEGGYNTSTDEVDGLTFVDGMNGYGYIWFLSGLNHWDIRNLGAVRGQYGIITGSSRIYNCHMVGMEQYGLYINALKNIVENCAFCNNTNGVNATTVNFTEFINCKISNNLGDGVSPPTAPDRTIYRICDIKNNNGYGIGLANSDIVTLYSCVFDDNVTSSVQFSASNTLIESFNCLFDSTPYNTPDADSNTSRFISINHNQTVDNHLIATSIGTIVEESTIRNTASGISWKVSPTSTSLCGQYNPLRLKVTSVAVIANTVVTASIYVRRTNAGITAKLFIPIAEVGILAEVSDTAAASADTWEQLSITFTPLLTGVADIYVDVYGGTTYSVYLDDFSIS